MSGSTEPDEMTPDEMQAHRSVYENAQRCMTLAVMAMGPDISQSLFGALVAAQRAWVLYDTQAQAELESWEFAVNAVRHQGGIVVDPDPDRTKLVVEALGYILRAWDDHEEICRESHSGRYLDRCRAEEYLSDTLDWFEIWLHRYEGKSGARIPWIRPAVGAAH